MELSAAILIVGGITAIIGGAIGLLVGPSVPASAGLPPIVVIGLGVVGIATGVLIRDGRLWRVCINIVALTMVVYVLALPNPLAAFYLVLGAIAMIGVLRYRAWFDWTSPPPTVAA